MDRSTANVTNATSNNVYNLGKPKCGSCGKGRVKIDDGRRGEWRKEG